MRHSAVSYVTRSDGRILVVWNGHYGCWAMPGGKVEDDEAIEVAQARELCEETCLSTNSAREIYCARSGVDPETMVHVFRVESLDGPPEEGELGRPVTWFTREELLKWSVFRGFYRVMFERLEDPNGGLR